MLESLCHQMDFWPCCKTLGIWETRSLSNFIITMACYSLRLLHISCKFQRFLKARKKFQTIPFLDLEPAFAKQPLTTRCYSNLLWHKKVLHCYFRGDAQREKGIIYRISLWVKPMIEYGAYWQLCGSFGRLRPSPTPDLLKALKGKEEGRSGKQRSLRSGARWKWRSFFEVE